jgi:hypothetical protein
VLINSVKIKYSLRPIPPVLDYKTFFLLKCLIIHNRDSKMLACLNFAGQQITNVIMICTYNMLTKFV